MRKGATFAELLGLKAVSGKDITGNLAHPASQDPNRTKMPNRYETLDKFEPGREKLVGDATTEDFSADDNDDENALCDLVEPAQFANSQLDPTEELPSTKNVNRFVHQQRNK